MRVSNVQVSPLHEQLPAAYDRASATKVNPVGIPFYLWTLENTWVHTFCPYAAEPSGGIHFDYGKFSYNAVDTSVERGAFGESALNELIIL
jgi:hypothetical protein